MKWLRATILVGLTFGLLAMALYWTRTRQHLGFATPADCVDAYINASKDGDVAKYLECLGEPLSSEKRRVTSQDLQRGMEGVGTYARIGDNPVIKDSMASVDVEKVRRTGTTPVKFRLENSGKGWLIVGIEEGKEVPSAIRYGTRVGEEP